MEFKYPFRDTQEDKNEIRETVQTIYTDSSNNNLETMNNITFTLPGENGDDEGGILSF